MFIINAAINPWIYLTKNEAFTLLRQYVSRTLLKRFEKVTPSFHLRMCSSSTIKKFKLIHALVIFPSISVEQYVHK